MGPERGTPYSTQQRRLHQDGTVQKKPTLDFLRAKHEAPGSPTPTAAAAGAADGGERDPRAGRPEENGDLIASLSALRENREGNYIAIVSEKGSCRLDAVFFFEGN
jgi:hypothetical protein